MSNINKVDLTSVELEEIRVRVDRVRNHLKQSTSAWLSIAAEFALAKQKLSKLAFERFANDVGFTTSVAEKFVKIGCCSVLYIDNNLETLTSVEGWTVLYAIAVLETNQIKALLKKVVDEKIKITREVVSNFVASKSLNDRKLIVASIEIDENHLKTLTRNQFDSFQNQLKQLDTQINKLNAGLEIKKRDKIVTLISNTAIANSESIVIKKAA